MNYIKSHKKNQKNFLQKKQKNEENNKKSILWWDIAHEHVTAIVSNEMKELEDTIGILSNKQSAA